MTKIGILMALELLLGCASLGNSRDSPAAPPAPMIPWKEGKAIDAWVVTQLLVEKMLVAPSTADWPWRNMAKDMGGGRYFIRTHVDAQNRFGAKLRNQILCNLQYDPDKKAFEVLELRMWE